MASRFVNGALLPRTFRSRRADACGWPRWIVGVPGLMQFRVEVQPLSWSGHAFRNLQ
jgi:hypothetical protein